MIQKFAPAVALFLSQPNARLWPARHRIGWQVACRRRRLSWSYSDSSSLSHDGVSRRVGLEGGTGEGRPSHKSQNRDDLADLSAGRGQNCAMRALKWRRRKLLGMVAERLQVIEKAGVTQLKLGLVRVAETSTIPSTQIDVLIVKP